jgi:prevent-host-death family protein
MRIILSIGRGSKMKFITVTELNQRATHIVSEIESTKEEVVITKNGKPVVLMRLVSDSDFGTKEIKKRGKEMKKHGKRNLQKR